MNELELARQEINKADREIAKYFEMRMKASKAIAEYKKKNLLPIYDPDRENAVIENNSKLIEDEELRQYYVLFQKNVMDVSKLYQRAIVSGTRVAYSGVEGAYAHIAARRIFPGGQHISYPNFEKAYEAVELGECDCVVLPIENSVAGEVGSNLDMIYSGGLFMNGTYDLKITHNLLAKPGTALSDIELVISHSQALEQCYEYIKRNGFRTENVVNTAVAAKMVSESDDRSIAAIASRETAELYGLEIIAEGINTSSMNTTRFAVLSRSDSRENTSKYFTLGIAVKHEAGALAKVVQIIGKYGYNMMSIKSRAMKDKLWQYYFFIEIEGNLNCPEGQSMADELRAICTDFRVIGAYGDHEQLEN